MKYYLIPFLILNSFFCLYADENIEEIIVTAELTNNSLYDVPLSVTIIDDLQIKNRNAQHLDDILYTIPNMNYSTGSSRGKFLQIRGIGERSEFVEPVNYSVGIILDGIDLTGISLAASTFDIQQVEVLRGPQGTLYGANALAGLVNMISNNPTDSFYSELSGLFSEYGGKSIGAIISGPINNDIGYRIGIKNYQSDGFINNDYLKVDDTNNIDEFVGRIKISGDIDNTLYEFNLFYTDIDNGYDAFSLDNTRTTLSDEPGHDRQETSAVSFKIRKKLKNNSELDFLLSHADSELQYGYDEDWSNVNICNGTACDFSNFGFDWWYSSFDNYKRDNSNYTIDVRYSSNISNIPWVLGVYYREQSIDLIREYTYLGNNFKSTFDTENTAIYGQFNLPFSQNMDLVAGLRFEEREAKYIDNNGAAPEDFVCIAIYPKPESCLFNNEYQNSENFWGGKIALKNQISENTMIYFLVSRGYKPGGVNIDGKVDEENLEYTSEIMANFEIGAKSILFDRKLYIQTSLFYQDRKDVQTKQSLVTSIASGLEGDTCPCTFTDYIGNAVSGSNFGLELEMLLMVNNNIELSAHIGILETELKNYFSYSHVGSDPTKGIAVNLSGREQSHAPSYQLSLGLSYKINKYAFVKFDIESKDEFYFSDRHSVKSDDYTLLNLLISYRKDKWEFNIFAKNLTDEDYQTRGFGSFGNDPRKFYKMEPYYQYAAPRVVGISGRRSF